MDGLGFYILLNSISVISGRWQGEHELCAMKRCFYWKKIFPPAGFKPKTLWSQAESANPSVKRRLLFILAQATRLDDCLVNYFHVKQIMICSYENCILYYMKIYEVNFINSTLSTSLNLSTKHISTWLLRGFTNIWDALMTKPTMWHVRPANTQISLGICPVWSESSLSAWWKLGPIATHWEHSEASDQTGRMPRLIWVFAECTCHFVGFVMRRLIYIYALHIGFR